MYLLFVFYNFSFTFANLATSGDESQTLRLRYSTHADVKLTEAIVADKLLNFDKKSKKKHFTGTR